MKEDSREVEAILRRMEQIRRGLDEDVQDIVEGARDLGKWRYYVKTYPWIFLGAAVMGGYLIVPRRRVSRLIPATIDADSATNDRQPTPVPSISAGKKSSFGSRLVAIVGSMALRMAISHAIQQADKFYATRARESARRNVTHDLPNRHASTRG